MEGVMQLLSYAGVLLLGSIIGGCASYTSEDIALKKASLEKEAAYIRLAKAITGYCSASTQTLDARQSCIVERRLAAERPDTTQKIVPTAPFLSQLGSSH
jgi:hypothetical protein